MIYFEQPFVSYKAIIVATKNTYILKWLFLCCCDHRPDLRRERRCVIRNTVRDRPFDAAGFHGFAVDDLLGAERREDLEILERIAVNDDQIGFVADANSPDAYLLCRVS